MRMLGLFLAVTFSGYAQEVAGDWHGWIEIKNDAPLRLALHIARGAGLSATIDSMDEGGAGLPVDKLIVRGAKVRFEMSSVGGVYDGTVADAGSRISGSWTQDGGVWPLIWERGADPASLTQPIDAAEATTLGQLCTQWLYSGDFTDLWAKLSPVMRQAFGDEAGLSAFRADLLQRWGAEQRLISEDVEISGALQVYRRVATFARHEGAVQVRLGFDPRGAAALLEIIETSSGRTHLSGRPTR
jgi:hypothetical protein